MLEIHQPYKSKYVFAFVSIGALLLGSFVIANSALEKSIVYAAGDSRTIHDIDNMQEMTQQICSNTDEGDTENLLDSRGGANNYYKIMKMLDGTCWMVENLRLPAETEITPDDSDVESNYTLPINASINSNIMSWGTDNGTAYMAEGATSMKLNSDSSWKEAYGNYYSWCAATAMSCKLNRTGSALSDADAAESICPKGWKLPLSVNGVGSFQSLYNEYPNSNTAGWVRNQTIPYNGSTSTGYNGLKLGYNSTRAIFPAAGYVNSSGLSGTASGGYYWSRRANTDTSLAYRLYFYSSAVSPQNNNGRYLGYSVRCVALGGLDKIEKPMWEESKDGNINVTMPTVITIDAASGMQDTAEANKITEGTIIAKVTSNGEHEVLLSAVEPSLKDPKVTTAEVSPVSESNPAQPGNNAWGIWNSTTNTYDPITTEAKAYDETITDGIDSQKVHTYQVGISISPALPAGTYVTEVTVTAAAK